MRYRALGSLLVSHCSYKLRRESVWCIKLEFCVQQQWRIACDRWKYLNGILKDAKVFMVRGGYPFIRKALAARGW